MMNLKEISGAALVISLCTTGIAHAGGALALPRDLRLDTPVAGYVPADGAIPAAANALTR